MNPDPPNLAAAALTALLQATLLIGGGWFFLLAQSKTSAARRSLIGRLTMAAAFLLAAIQILPAVRFPALSTAVVPSSAPALPQGTGRVIGAVMPDSSLTFSAENQTPAPPRAAANASAPPQLELPPPCSPALLGLWLAGACAVLLPWLASLIHRCRLRAESAPGRDFLQSLPDAADLRAIPGWALVDDVRILSGNITPCVWGIWKTTLALPRAATAWPPEKRRLVITHECAHLLRRDPLWQMITRFFLALFWFHPLAWNLARRTRAADEQAADDRVLTTTPDAPSYAALLVECARQFSQPRATRATLTAMATPASLTSRVESILSPATDRRAASTRSLLGPSAFLLTFSSAVLLQVPAIAITETGTGPSAPPADVQEPSKLFDPPIAPTPPPASPPTPASSDPASLAKHKTEAVTEAKTDEPSPPQASAPPAAKTTIKDFNWQPVSLNGVDYLPLGQLKDFYQFRRLETEESGTRVLRSHQTIVKLKPGSRELFVNNVKFHLRDSVAEQDGGMLSRHDLGYILDPALRPGAVKAFRTVSTVVIDAGHGGTDSGAMGLRGKESFYTLDTALRLQRRLEEAGIKTILTRPDDSFLPLKERVALASAQSDAILISLHFGHAQAGERGLRTCYPDEAGARTGNPDDPDRDDYYRASLGLATAVHANSLYKLRCQDGGIRAARYSVISGGPPTPCILFEGGNLAHPEEALLIDTEAYRQSIAEAIAGGIQNYIRSRARSK